VLVDDFGDFDVFSYFLAVDDVAKQWHHPAPM